MDEQENSGSRDSNDVYSNAVRAGKRTYFFDVRSTRSNDYYLTITESKRMYNEDGSHSYKKHKIFLYKEDFEKFSEALKDSFIKIIDLNKEQRDDFENKVESQFSDISFDDLGRSEHESDSETSE